MTKQNIFSQNFVGAYRIRPENCLNQDFNKIFKMSRINLENPKNLNKIVVQDKNIRFTSLRGTKQSSSITNLSSFNFSKVQNFGKVKTACGKGNKAESLTATAWGNALRNKRTINMF